MPQVSIADIVSLVGGRYDGPADAVIRGVSTLAEAGDGDLAFLGNAKYAEQLAGTRASAVLVEENEASDDPRWIRVAKPHFALAQVVSRWFDRRPMPRGISPRSSVASSAKLGRDIAIGPFATIGDDVTIGDGVTIFQGVSIEAGSTIGDGTIIYPNVVIYDRTTIGRRCIIHANVVIGGDGFSFTFEGGRHQKIPQVGTVRIEDDVEIGAGTTIDRAGLGETVIGEGSKIDNLVQIAHGVKLGKHSILVSQSGIAGSAELGDYVQVGGQSGIAGHLKIGRAAKVAAKSAVMSDVPDGATVRGVPAVPIMQFARREVILRRLVKKG